MGLKLITANTDWAVSLDEARTHLLKTSTDTDDDVYIQTLIEAAQKLVEDQYGLGLTAQTWDLYLDDFPKVIEVWVSPVASIDSVKYTDDDGATQTITSTNYATDLTQKPARIAPINSYTWPVPRDSIGAVQVRFTTGFTSPDTVPSDIKQAMLLLVGDWFDNREDKGRRFNRVSELILTKYGYK